MNWLTQTLSSTIGKKLIMALTGSFLIIFLIGHMSGNLLLFNSDARPFNEYAYFMAHNPAVKLLSYLTYLSIIGHVIYSIILTIHNQKSRPQSYAYSKPSANSKWASRNMGILGTIILIFLVIHLKSFWFEAKFGNLPIVTYDGKEYKDLYTIVKAAFAQWWYVAFYVISMIFLAFHLSHGFLSAFRTLGLGHPKYTPLIKGLGVGFSIIVSATFAAMPIYMFLMQQ